MIKIDNGMFVPSAETARILIEDAKRLISAGYLSPLLYGWEAFLDDEARIREEIGETIENMLQSYGVSMKSERIARSILVGNSGWAAFFWAEFQKSFPVSEYKRWEFMQAVCAELKQALQSGYCFRGEWGTLVYDEKQDTVSIRP